VTVRHRSSGRGRFVKQPCNNPQVEIARCKPAIQSSPIIQLRHANDFFDARGLLDAMLETRHEVSPDLIDFEDFDETHQIFIDLIFVGSAQR
jgi:hypothetical protein